MEGEEIMYNIMSNSDRKKLASIRNGELIPEHDGEYWCKEDIENLKKQYLIGTDVSKLALMLGRSETAIMNQIANCGLLEEQNKTKKRNKRKNCDCLCRKCNALNCPNRREVYQGRDNLA